MKGIKNKFNNKQPEEIEPTNKDIVYFNIAKEISKLSKDKNTKVGAIVVDVYGKVVSMGYNGCVSKFGCNNSNIDTDVPHSREEETIKLSQPIPFLGVDKKEYKYNKYPFMIHAEQNALLTASDMNRLIGATIYCTHYPCTVCANMIAQVGIKNVNVLDNRHGTFEDTIVPTLFIYENKDMILTIYKEDLYVSN